MGHCTFIALSCALSHCKYTCAFVLICFFLGSKLIYDLQTMFSGFTEQQKKDVKHENETIIGLIMPLRKFRKIFYFQTVVLGDPFLSLFQLPEMSTTKQNLFLLFHSSSVPEAYSSSKFTTLDWGITVICFRDHEMSKSRWF